MSEKKRSPHQSGSGKGNVSQNHGHLCDKTADELLTELEDRMDEMTDLTMRMLSTSIWLHSKKKLLSKKILMWNAHGRSSVHSMQSYSMKALCPNLKLPTENLTYLVSEKNSQESL